MSLSLGLVITPIILGYLSSPRGYIITKDALTIVRTIKPILIPLSSITEAAEAKPEMLANSTRIFGSHGLWGRFGHYHNDILGDYKLYTRKDGGHVLIRGAETYILAPERPMEFLLALRKAQRSE